MKALVGAFNQEKALVGAFSVIVQPVVEPMEHYTAQCQGHRAGLLVAFIHLKRWQMSSIIQGGYESEEKGDKIGPGGDFGVYR